MADNIVLGTSGQTISTDDLGGVQVPRMKIQIGADGAGVDVLPPSDALANASCLPAGQMLWNGTNWERDKTVAADGVAATGIGSEIDMVFNGSTYDRPRGNIEGALLASAARTVTTSSPNQINYNGHGVIMRLNVTVVGTGTLQIVCLGVDPVSSTTYTIASGSTVSSSSFMAVYPGLSNAYPNMNAVLPRTWLAQVVKSDGSSWTFSLGYQVIS